MSTTESRDSRVRELERRIEELEAQDEAALGHFTFWDWTACIVGTIAVPILIVWRYAA